jgi:hypothetical protein
MLLAHRIIWKMVHDAEPEQIDHINRDPLDNRLCNLRAATPAQNAWNRRTGRTNGFRGVTRRGRRWRARIIVHRREILLGMFDSPLRAYEAYMRAALRYRGEFARLD